MDIIEQLLSRKDYRCSCGKVHNAGLSRVIIEKGAIRTLPEIVRSYGAKKVFLLADPNTFATAGKRVSSLLSDFGIPHVDYILPNPKTEPDESAVGSVIMHFDLSCDLILSVGSGVVNDLGKICAVMTGRNYVVFGTAPSMDGYASATSSMVRDGLKYSMPTKCPDTVVGDLDILCQAPMDMIAAGFGDMLAKYISIAEWKISHIINGEYYCPEVADLIMKSLQNCVDNLEGLSQRDPEAVRAIMRGMVLAGVAMNYAGVSRPASGMEHYISHICDMRGVAFGTPVFLHGIQVGASTVMSLGYYEKLRNVKPNREKALTYVHQFSYEKWADFMRKQVGAGAEAMIANEKTEGKYNPKKHAERLERIIGKWDEIRQIIISLPTSEELVPKLKKIGIPTHLTDLGLSKEEAENAVFLSKDIRDKYVGTRLLWDLGLLDDFVRS